MLILDQGSKPDKQADVKALLLRSNEGEMRPSEGNPEAAVRIEDDDWVLIIARKGIAQTLLRSDGFEATSCALTDEVALKLIRSIRRRRVLSETPCKEASIKVNVDLLFIKTLSRRELQVLRLAAQGLLAKEVAQRLDIGLETVNTHLQHIYRKLGVRSRTEAVVAYLKNRESRTQFQVRR